MEDSLFFGEHSIVPNELLQQKLDYISPYVGRVVMGGRVTAEKLSVQYLSISDL